MSNQEEFLSLFEFEVQNRLMAYNGNLNMVKRSLEPEVLEWYQAYLVFETLNQQRYTPVAEKFGIATKPNFTTRMQVLIGGVALRVLSEITVLKYMLKETVKYVSQLERLRDIAPAEDKAFFDYVVDQEVVQVDTLKLRIAGESEKATAVLNDFVAQHENQEIAQT